MKNRPNILTIAGFDPSGGAGILADIKTIESLKGYGVAVCTANTIQNDIKFLSCDWVNKDIIKEQLDSILERFTISFVKIGVVKNWKTLHFIIDHILDKVQNIKIILDPVLKSSTAYAFQNPDQDKELNHEFDKILEKIHLITPNYKEIQMLYPDQTIDEAIKHISCRTHLFLKGGHREDAIGKDELFTTTGKHYILNPKGNKCSEKHGSGCVLSSAITTYLALGYPLLKSCLKAKRYTEKILSSNDTLLGYHKM
ncbi:hydroxymethylpyrimidine/phosphomethylpyrimidine kinase [Aquimarina algicola]|uniref:hydroxymethylpyrimidine kinase n=1 Tax=Aquimarina algicola TaxID=2589995 RepID=A0A504JGL4_9FLAO|nr:hydroxymethylpyrimidine/phosphomethylpyrimidine kinase [Aquimarina algicola]TPN87565.1 hydroxymethylpyrimidine/phosphomethylpyrimidine kinase [Aquimarina algicola]